MKASNYRPLDVTSPIRNRERTKSDKKSLKPAGPPEPERPPTTQRMGVSPIKKENGLPKPALLHVDDRKTGMGIARGGRILVKEKLVGLEPKQRTLMSKNLKKSWIPASRLKREESEKKI